MLSRTLLLTFVLVGCATAGGPEQRTEERPPPVHQRVIDRILTPPPEGDPDLGGGRA